MRVGDRALQIAERCRAGRLLVFDEGDLLVMFPALTVDEATVTEALDILEGALV